jgi:hypothetical protein
MRVQYAQMHSVILDLAVTFVQQMKTTPKPPDSSLPSDSPTHRGDACTPTTGNCAHERGCRERDRVASAAKREFLRLLNLTHVLFLSQAGE